MVLLSWWPNEFLGLQNLLRLHPKRYTISLVHFPLVLLFVYASHLVYYAIKNNLLYPRLGIILKVSLPSLKFRRLPVNVRSFMFSHSSNSCYFISTYCDTLGEGNSTPLQYSCLANPMDGGAWWAAVYGVARNQTWLSDFTFTFHFHALEKAMATHSSVLAWSIPGTGEPGGLPSIGSHRVGHDWSDLAAASSSIGILCTCFDWLECSVHSLCSLLPSGSQ